MKNRGETGEARKEENKTGGEMERKQRQKLEKGMLLRYFL